MGTPSSTNDSVIDFVFGRNKAKHWPTPEQWATIIKMYTGVLFGDLKYYGFRELRPNEGTQLDRLVARAIMQEAGRQRLRLIYTDSSAITFYLSENMTWLIVETDTAWTWVSSWRWVSGDDFARIIESKQFPLELPIRLLKAIFDMVAMRLEEAEHRVNTFREARDILKPFTENLNRLPLPALT